MLSECLLCERNYTMGFEYKNTYSQWSSLPKAYKMSNSEPSASQN